MPSKILPQRLLRYIIKRALFAIPVILILLTGVFIVMHVLPGDPVELMLGENASQEQLDILRHALGLDKPIPIQYVDYLSMILRGDFGETVRSESIAWRIGRSIGPTLELAIVSVLFALVVGVPAGLLAAAKRGTLVDRGIRVVTLLGYAMPVFVFALLSQLLFSQYWALFPSSGTIDGIYRTRFVTGVLTIDSLLAFNLPAFVNSIQHLILPAIVLGIELLPPVVGLTRENTIKALSEDYITMSRAMGLPESSVLGKHAFRNALLPLITYTGFRVAALLGGAVLVELVFSRPGLGSLLVDAIQARDYMLVQGVIVYVAIIISVITLIVDISYALVDPRVKY